ncbi:probable ATP-dependent RNA helicase DDX60 isoform X2 [Tiliqua scincoides]|uniref:probable ATP-dependent RNA helicase DDX60 isoform X2 n=1 Tax=Tiliqua scincoides TaxID=71010 RepID=UPI0034621467
MPKRKTAKSTKASRKQEKFVGSLYQQNLAKTGNLKRPQVALITVPSEQDLQNLMGKITNIIFKEIPKTEANLLNDYDEFEFILIDGDSLFITCANDLTLLQGQSLHFFYMVECFLLDFTSKGAKCIIVFFKDAEHVYFGNPDLLSLRAALIVHLINNTNIPVKTEFSNCFDKSWQDFLKRTSPYFLIISDEGLNKSQTNFLHIFIFHALSKRNSIVFTSGQESDTVRIYGYRIHGGQSHQQFFKQYEADIELCLKSLLKPLEEAATHELLSLLRCICLEAVQRKVHRKYLSVLDKKEDSRYIVCIVSCALALEIHNKELQSPSAAIKQESMLTLQEAADLIRMYCLSVAFLHYLPLSQRAQVRLIGNDWNPETSVLIQQHKLSEFLVLNNLNSEILLKMDMSSLPDLSDNLLWKNIAYYYEVEKGPEFELDITSNICRDYEYLWNGISMLLKTVDIGASFPLRITSKCFLTKTCSPREQSVCKMKVQNPRLIPMACSVVDEFAGDILNDVPFLRRDDPAVTSLKKWNTVNDHHCWFSRRSLSDDYLGTAGDVWALQNELLDQTSECIYGESLEDKSSTAIGTKLDNSKQTSVVKKSKNKHKKKAEIIVEKNQKQKRAEEIRKKEESQWNDAAMSIEREMKENFKSGLTSLDRIVKTFQDTSVKLTIEMTGLNACFEKWKELCKDKSKTEKDLNLAAEVMRKIHSLITNYQDLLKEADYQQVVTCLRYLGFNNLIAASEHTKIPRSKKEEVMRKLSKYAVGIGSARFQLQYMSQYLIKEERDDPDPRVQHFIPDTWQRTIFDIVDKGESAVIVAPPSSGKSYASYYCMEKILKSGDEGVVVYVAPTQALVNQVRTTVHNQFKKKLPDGLTVCGVFTQGYRHAAVNCQILVTMPHCLETLFLSPHHQEWVKRIRYVIFDEVCYHGLDIRAEVWEHLLLMIQCPFLVLCAALKNPEHLVDWLQSVKRYWQKHAKITTIQNLESAEKTWNVNKCSKEQRESYRVKLVVHEERYNDLERYVCSVKDEDVTIHHYHPFAALTVDYIKKNDFPINLSLSPQETVILYDTMVKINKNWAKAQELDPEKYVHFKDKTIITKMDAKCYEETLKEELKLWIKYHPQEANQVLEKLKPRTSLCSENQMKGMFPHFVAKLQQMDKLPALFFIFNIKRVGELAKRVGWFLEEKQREKQISGPAKQESLSSKKSGMTEKSVKTTQADVMRRSNIYSKILARRAEHENMMKQLEKISEMPIGCTYANCQAVDMKILYKIFDQSRLMAKPEDLQKLALKGIGTHHAYMEMKERHFVELLFKMGFIQVVTATGTLALGINTPCKSVVFVQSSEYLDALNYRWICGRAGQRGQHLLGNVFFYNFSLPKIAKLVRSNEPQIQGQFLLRISLILRLLLFASIAEDKTNARAKFVSLLKNSLLSFEQPNLLRILKLYFLFSFQFFLKEGYVDQEGNTVGFSELVTQLHCHEPSNFVFADFLSKGLFYRLCLPSQKGSKFSIDVMEKLVLVLAHLFGRKYMSATVVKSEQKFSQSKVFLDDLPEDFGAALDAYNRKIEENFGQFLLTVSRLADVPEKYQLPISKLDFSNKKQSYSPLVSRIMSCDQERMAISPFVCLSGNSDLALLHAGTANSVILHTLGISAANIPTLHSKKYDKLGRRMPLNGYALDFYKHGSLTAVIQDNGLHDGEAYRMLKDFAFTIQTISISLREHCGRRDLNVMKAFEQLSYSYRDKLEGVMKN